MRNNPQHRVAAYLKLTAFAEPQESETGTYAAFRVHPATAKALRGWAKRNGIENVYNADELHVTTVYSKTTLNYQPMGVLDNEPLRAKFAGYKMFGDDGAMLVVRVEHPQLHQQWAKARKLGMTWDWPDYSPHITISKEHSLTEDRLNELSPIDFPILLSEEYSAPLDKDWASKVTASLPNGWEHRGKDSHGREIYRNDTIDMDAVLQRNEGGQYTGTIKTRTTKRDFGPVSDPEEAFLQAFENMDIQTKATAEPEFARGDRVEYDGTKMDVLKVSPTGKKLYVEFWAGSDARPKKMRLWLRASDFTLIHSKNRY